MEKLTQLSEKNQVTALLTYGHSGIEQNETADRVATETLSASVLQQLWPVLLNCN